MSFIKLVRSLQSPRLTVLAYHRVLDLESASQDIYKLNVTDLALFKSHMDYIHKNFNAVSIEDILLWLNNKQDLPERPVLISFDDGYRDNLTCALPVLQEMNLPAIIFLTTDYIGNTFPFYCDISAWCFHHTKINDIYLPLIGRCAWTSKSSRINVLNEWLKKLKTVDNDMKNIAMEQLPEILGLNLPPKTFDELILTWDNVKTLISSGISIGSHTQSHAILTRVSEEQAYKEITNSKTCIEEKTGYKISCFAYPNGMQSDFSSKTHNMLRSAGYEAAFTLLHGPAKLSEIRQNPLAIRRIYISGKDNMPRFIAKLSGIPRILKQLGLRS
ncbi:MAG: polysaccharide deacetylase family protein [Candidatus Theseobacter exili]|nr:polysaccharide deacetylase family protein [Candidatus Theseobacter exili]